jgi:hypothetical protein
MRIFPISVSETSCWSSLDARPTDEEAQRSAIEQECARKGWTLLRIEQDVASGKSTNGRPGLHGALESVRTGEALRVLDVGRAHTHVTYVEGRGVAHTGFYCYGCQREGYAR